MSALSSLFDELVEMYQPLVDTATDPWLLDKIVEPLGTDSDALGNDFLSHLHAFASAVAVFESAIETPPESLSALATMLDALRTVLDAGRTLPQPMPDGGAFASAVLELLATRHLFHRCRLAFELGVALGIIQFPAPPSSGVLANTRPQAHIVADKIQQALTDPLGILRTGLPTHPLATTTTANTTMDVMVERIGGVASALGIPWRYGYRAEDASQLGTFTTMLDHAVLLLAPRRWWGTDAVGIVIQLSAADSEDLGVVLSPFGSLTLETDLAGWHASMTCSADIEGVAFGGGAGFRLLAGGGAVDATLALALTQIVHPDAPATIVGPTDGTRLELKGASAHATVALAASACTVDLGIEIDQATFVLTADGGDGFLRNLLGDQPLTATVKVGLSYRSGSGLHLTSGSGLTVQIPTLISVGPVQLQQVALTVPLSAQTIDALLTATLRVALGPVALTVHGMGVRANVALPSDSPPQQFDLDIGYRPPDGAVLAISTSVVSGGGYLQFAAPTYSGALALTAGGVKIDAFGVLDTAAPGGWSLAAIVSTQFHAIPLGLGFTLQGVGGLVAVNRRVDTDALRAVLRGAGLDDIFFPADPIAHAARLTGDLATYFPAEAGKYVVGPAVKIGWGTPQLVDAELAVLLELPDPLRIVLIGSMHSALPSQSHALVALNVDVIGELDLTRKRLAIDASLRDSKVLTFPIIGDLALRLGWGDQPAFVLSIGGFHSHFTPPPGFPSLARVRIPIGADDDPRLDATGFLALTSNTAQIGAGVDLYASEGLLNLKGWIGFEALFQFSPFSFEAELSAGIALRRGNTTLAGVHLDGTLTGPTPWRVAGEACLSLWLIDLCVHFHASFGSDHAVTLPTADLWTPLQAALQTPASWSASVPVTGVHAVTTAPPIDETSPPPRIEPLAALTVKQSVMPLDRPITSYGGNALAAPQTFALTGATLGGAAVDHAPVTDWFAPAQFEDLSDADRLSRSGFEPMDAGAVLGAAAVRSDTGLATPLIYDTVLIAPNRPSPPRFPYALPAEAQLRAVDLSAGARAPLATAARGAFALPRAVAPPLAPGASLAERFVIASSDLLAWRNDLGAPMTRSRAELALAAHLASVPADAGTLAVVPHFEAV